MAPPVTARIEPVGRRLENGRQVFLAFSLDSNISIWEKGIKLPGVEGGDAIDITTQWNSVLHQKAMRQLADITDATMTVGYDPACLPQILAIVNQPGAFTIHLPNGSSISYWGGLKTFDPSEFQDGEFPEATCNIIVTNTDPLTGLEEGPLYTAPPPPPPPPP